MRTHRSLSLIRFIWFSATVWLILALNTHVPLFVWIHLDEKYVPSEDIKEILMDVQSIGQDDKETGACLVSPVALELEQEYQLF